MCSYTWNGSQWVSEESTLGAGFSQAFEVSKKLFSEQTPYQKLEVFETTQCGNLMILDGAFQNTEADDFFYHEMLTHVPMFVHKNPRRVLIVGGGDGGAAREILKHSSVEEVIQVDIDKRVTDVSRQYFKKIAIALDHPKLKLEYADAAEFIKDPKFDAYFDIVVIDSSDPVGVNESLFTADFYARVSKILREGGIANCQAETMWLHPNIVRASLKKIKSVFTNVEYYWFLTPVYPSGNIGSIIMTNDSNLSLNAVHPDRNEDAIKMAQHTEYYNSAMHSASFVKPNFWTPDGPALHIGHHAQ